ncbi:hypothetical protein C9374_004303 [Naegleria lovaniensis]|uniref:RWD domain-containing protein n=1 Tax=Naegleria lovaniensis TaxID=51637 RepID=A0AA88GSN5_NAELO|nr:uncharacterized protein C9374_004303 [Naegleria lovaniensis]KAG2383632.1 hypothetical protein C9374_004303 [Naegleria lovaniensis]
MTESATTSSPINEKSMITNKEEQALPDANIKEYEDDAQDPMERSQEIEALQSIYWEDFKLLASDRFEITIRGKLELTYPSPDNITQGHFSVSEIPFKASHIGLSLTVTHVHGYPSKTIPNIELLPLYKIESILDLLNKSSQVYAQVNLKKELLNEELAAVKQSLLEKAEGMIGSVMVYALVQEIEEYLEKNNIVKSSVILRVTKDSEIEKEENKASVKIDAKYGKEVEPSQVSEKTIQIQKKKVNSKGNVSLENIQFFGVVEGRITVNHFVNQASEYSQILPRESYWLNRYCHASAAENSSCFMAFGGIFNGSFSRDLVCYKNDRAFLQQNNPAVFARIFHTFNYMASLNAYALIGGLGESGEAYNDCWIYSSNSSWINAKPIPYKCYMHTTSITGDKVAVFGGFDGENYIGTLSIGFFGDIIANNSIDNRWSVMKYPHGPSPRAGSSSFIVNDVVYIYGGKDASTYFNEMYCFDLNMKYWISVIQFGTCPSVAFAGNFCIGNNSNSMLLYGGYNGMEWNKRLYEFSVTTNTWSLHVNSLIDNRIAFCSVHEASKGTLVITGGNENKTRLKG